MISNQNHVHLFFKQTTVSGLLQIPLSRLAKRAYQQTYLFGYPLFALFCLNFQENKMFLTTTLEQLFKY